MTDDVLTRIPHLVAPALAACGVELFGAQWDRHTQTPVLRLLIDRPGGVSLADCERVSAAVAPLLDSHDPIAHAYHLEVSSPGAERELRDLDDWKRHVGARVNVRFRSGEADTVVEGLLLSVGEQAIEVEARDRRGPRAVDVPLASILGGRLAVEI